MALITRPRATPSEPPAAFAPLTPPPLQRSRGGRLRWSSALFGLAGLLLGAVLLLPQAAPAPVSAPAPGSEPPAVDTRAALLERVRLSEELAFSPRVR